MKQIWHANTLQYCFYSLLLMAFLLPITESGTDIAYVLAAALALVSGVVWFRREQLYRHPINLYVLILLVMMLLGLTYTSGLAEKSTWMLLKQYLWIPFTPWLLLTIRTTQQRRKLINAFLWGNAIILVLSYGKVLGLLHFSNMQPAVVTRGHIPQNFFMSFACAVWLYFCFAKPKHRSLMMALFALSSINVFLCTSRTGYLNWFVLVLFVLYRHLAWKYFVLGSIAAVVFVGSLFAFSPIFQNRIHIAWQEVQQYREHTHVNKTSSMGIRAVQVSGGWELVKQRPWFGFGTGGLGSAYASLPVNTANEAKVNHKGIRTDITYMNVMVEHGFVGVAILLGFIATLWYYSYRLSSDWRVIAQIMVLAYFIAACFTSFLVSGFAVHFLSLMLALLYSDLPLTTKETSLNVNGALEA